MEKINGTKLSRALSYAVAVVLVLLPFHAFLTVWLSSVGADYTLVRLWKEIILLVLALPAGYILWSNHTIRSAVLHSRLMMAVSIFILLQLVSGLFALASGSVNVEAFGYALISNTRYLLLFMVVTVIVRQCNWLHWHWRTILLIPAVFVIGFGLLQYFVLPDDFLKHFGYGPVTIPISSTIDDKSEFIRIQSTLRGANPLGAYLVLIISALLALSLKYKHLRDWRSGLLIAALVALFLTSSRSGWIGGGVAMIIVLWLWLRSKGYSARRLFIASLMTIVLCSVGILTFRDNDYVQNYVFHTDENSKSSVSSNEARASALTNSAVDVARHPLGQGIGTAGPASVYNDRSPAKISENYFLQIGQETGWLGLGLFIFVLLGVARHLYLTRERTISVVLLASLIGLSVVNLFSHAWVDDTLSYLWWGLAAVAVAHSVIGDRKDEIREANNNR